VAQMASRRVLNVLLTTPEPHCQIECKQHQSHDWENPGREASEWHGQATFLSNHNGTIKRAVSRAR
jgi:hypothetical protein